MKRFFLVLAVAAAMAMMLVVMAAPAMASNGKGSKQVELQALESVTVDNATPVRDATQRLLPADKLDKKATEVALVPLLEAYPIEMQPVT